MWRDLVKINEGTWHIVGALYFLLFFFLIFVFVFVSVRP